MTVACMVKNEVPKSPGQIKGQALQMFGKNDKELTQLEGQKKLKQN